MKKLLTVILLTPLLCFALIPAKDFTVTGYGYGGNVQSKPEGVVTPPPSGGSAEKEPASTITISDITATNVTAWSSDNQFPLVQGLFDIDGVDLNSDGCPDFVLQPHQNDESGNYRNQISIYRQNVSSGNCAGTFTYAGQSQNHTANLADSKNNAAFIDLNQDGLSDYFGTDADSDPTSVFLNATTPLSTSIVIQKNASLRGCRYGKEICQMADFNGDGNIDTLHVSKGETDAARLYDITQFSNGNYVFDAGLTLSGIDIGQNGGGAAAPVIADFNNDSWPDFADATYNFIYLNTQNFTSSTSGFTKLNNSFPTDIDFLSKITFTSDGVGELHNNYSYRVALDYDSDGDFDMFVIRARKFYSGIYNPSGSQIDEAKVYMLRNNGDNTFSDVTAISGLSTIGFQFVNSYSTYDNIQVEDIDNNGDQDIIFTTVTLWTPPEAKPSVSGSTTSKRFAILKNTAGVFTAQTIDVAVSDDGTTGQTNPSAAHKRRIDVVDMDNDGKLDIIRGSHDRVSLRYENYRIWKNTTTNNNRWMRVKTIGVSPQHSQGLHAKLTWYEPGTNKVITTRQVFHNGWYGHVDYQHAGLGGYDRTDLEVRWPSGGGTYRYNDLNANQTLLAYSDGSLVANFIAGSGWSQTPPSTTDINLTVTPQSGINGANELVTTGLVFPVGQVSSQSIVRVLNDVGEEVPIFIKPTLRWHWKDGSVRAVKLQFRFNASTGLPKNYTVRIGKARSTTDIAEASVSEGYRASTAVADKASTLEPRVLATLPNTYLATAGITAPFSVPSSNNFDNVMWPAIQAVIPVYPYSGTGSSCAAWEYDRASTIFKAAMRTGNNNTWMEAYRSGRWYVRNIKRTGTSAVGSANERGNLLCVVGTSNGKYSYPEALMLHVALTGDDESITSISNGTATQDTPATLAKAMADYVWNEGSGTYYAGSKIPYAANTDTYTERAAGFRLASNSFAYEISGDQTYLTRVDTVLTNILNHQSGVNPDGYPPDGTWRHSWDAHEGNPYGNLSFEYDRRSSPWMMPTLVGYMWDIYHSGIMPAKQTQIANSIRDAGRGLTKFGYFDSYGYRKTGQSTTIFQSGITNGNLATNCNFSSGNGSGAQDSVYPLYSSLNTVNIDAVVDLNEVFTKNKGETLVGLQDEHNPQMFGVLAMARYFEDDGNPADTPEEARMDDYIARNENIFFLNCGSWLAGKIDDNQSFARKLNWSFHINPYGVWSWVKQEKGL